MADDFVYRSDPPATLAGDDITALVKMQEQAGLAVVTPGAPLTAAEMKAGPHEAIERLGRDLATARAATDLPVKLSLALPGANGLDPMLLGGLIGNLISDGATILEFDGSILADPAVESGDDGFTLSGLMRPEGFRLAIYMGALSAWDADRLAEVAEDLAADRYVFDVTPDDDFARLGSLPDDSLAVLGLVAADGASDADAVLETLDTAAEAFDEDRMALTAGPGANAAACAQIADIAVRFWGFAM